MQLDGTLGFGLLVLEGSRLGMSGSLEYSGHLSSNSPLERFSLPFPSVSSDPRIGCSEDSSVQRRLVKSHFGVSHLREGRHVRHRHRRATWWWIG